MQQPPLMPDMVAVGSAVGRAAEESRVLLERYLETLSEGPSVFDPMGIFSSFQMLGLKLLGDPMPLWRAHLEAARQGMAAWQHAVERSFGLARETGTDGAADRRFRDPEWQANPLFEFIRSTYQIYADALLKLALDADGLDDKTAKKVEFYTRQFIDAMAPTNFALTNPEVLRATVESGGANLVEGLRHFLEDIDPVTGQLRTRMVDKTGFRLGENIAASPGAVVFQNELMQLIQYTPSTARVRRRPLLIMPPWINPDASLRDKDFEDYMLEGPIAALDAIERATGEREVNAIGYCIGGTLLGATLAWLRARGDTRIQCATFFTAMLDFSEPGDLGVFIDERQISNLEQTMARSGYLDGKEMASTFNLLRANDLIWSFVVNNYLLGKSPAPFDLLFWNSDSTRMPACMHSTYLRNMYQENLLCQPGGMTLVGTPIDLRAIDIPTCFVSTIEDHIAPWKSTYRGAQVLGGEVSFILGRAGHVAGIINPPGPRAYGHFIGPAPRAQTADEWLAAAQPLADSWWTTWDEWVVQHAGGEVAAREPGAGALPALEPAPGSYVKRRIE